jgi:hypothetical protein
MILLLYQESIHVIFLHFGGTENVVLALLYLNKEDSQNINIALKS